MSVEDNGRFARKTDIYISQHARTLAIRSLFRKQEITRRDRMGGSGPMLSRQGPADPLLHLSAGVTQLLQFGFHGSHLRMTGVHLDPELVRLDRSVTGSRIRVPMMELFLSERSDVFFD